MKYYCPKCSLVYDNVMGDSTCPKCGASMESKPRGNRSYDNVILGTLGKEVKDG